MTHFLYLPDWIVTRFKIDIDGAYRIAAKYSSYPDRCPKCGSVGQIYKHGTKKQTYVDAPVRGRRTFVDVTRARFRCVDCLATFMQDLPDIAHDRRMTVRCRDYIEIQALLRPNTRVAEEVGIDETVVRKIAKRPGRLRAKDVLDDHPQHGLIVQCTSCKGLYYANSPNTAHSASSSADVAAGRRTDQRLCPDCHSFNTQNWFKPINDSASLAR